MSYDEYKYFYDQVGEANLQFFVIEECYHYYNHLFPDISTLVNFYKLNGESVLEALYNDMIENGE